MQNHPTPPDSGFNTESDLQIVKENALIGSAESIPISAPTPIVSVSPVVLTAPERAMDLQMRISAPTTGRDLPLLLFSHGYGGSNFLASMRGYGPLVDFYAAHGFVVIQPTHLSAKSLGLDKNGPEGPLFWKSRAQDMSFILDHLDEIEASVPGLGGRLDRSRVAAAGHSLGGHTVALLAGMRVTDPNTGEVIDLSEPRLRTAVIFAAPGNGSDLAAWASEHYPVLRNNDFSEMKMRALVVAGDQDVNPRFSDRPDWRADAYTLSPGPKCLLTIFGGKHMLGGISGYDAAETSDENDENPERVAVIQRLTWAYLRSELFSEDPAWSTACAVLEQIGNQGRVACK